MACLADRDDPRARRVRWLATAGSKLDFRQKTH